MSKSTLHTGIAVTITLLIVGIFFILGVPFSTSSINNQAAVGQSANQVAMQDVVVGQGAMVKPGDTITVNYTGTLQDGSVFDTSVGEAPISFTVGSGEIIPGVDQGVVGMQPGGKRILVIPPSLGYGPQNYGPIPGNSTIMFEIEVVSVQPAVQ